MPLSPIGENTTAILPAPSVIPAMLDVETEASSKTSPRPGAYAPQPGPDLYSSSGGIRDIPVDANSILDIQASIYHPYPFFLR